MNEEFSLMPNINMLTHQLPTNSFKQRDEEKNSNCFMLAVFSVRKIALSFICE